MGGTGPVRMPFALDWDGVHVAAACREILMEIKTSLFNSMVRTAAKRYTCLQESAGESDMLFPRPRLIFARGGSYNCMGRCGPGCGGSSWNTPCSNWSVKCLQHDVCSYYYSSGAAFFDSNCGDEWFHASPDWGEVCFWRGKNVCESWRHQRKYSTERAICD